MSKIIEYNIGDKVIDIKTNKVAKTLDDCIDYIKQQIKRFNIQTY